SHLVQHDSANLHWWRVRRRLHRCVRRLQVGALAATSRAERRRIRPSVAARSVFVPADVVASALIPVTTNGITGTHRLCRWWTAATKVDSSLARAITVRTVSPATGAQTSPV